MVAVRGKGKPQEEKGAGRCRSRIDMVSCRQAQLQTNQVLLQEKSSQLSSGKMPRGAEQKQNGVCGITRTVCSSTASKEHTQIPTE